VWCCGRICCEGDAAALNPFSVMMEGANGRRVKLDLSSISEFAVFPGQIVSGLNNESFFFSCLAPHYVPSCNEKSIFARKQCDWNEVHLLIQKYECSFRGLMSRCSRRWWLRVTT
jgi:hypothetical protein